MGKKGPSVQKMKNDMLYVWRRRRKEVQTNRYGGEKTQRQKSRGKLETFATL